MKKFVLKHIFDEYFNVCIYRYASLYFCCCIEREDNELLTLEIIHRYVELLDKYFGNVWIFLLIIEHVLLSTDDVKQLLQPGCDGVKAV